MHFKTPAFNSISLRCLAASKHVICECPSLICTSALSTAALHEHFDGTETQTHIACMYTTAQCVCDSWPLGHGSNTNFLFRRVSSAFLWGRQPPCELKHMREIHTQDRADGFSCQSQWETVWPSQNMARMEEKKEAMRNILSSAMDRYPFQLQCIGL